MTPTRHSIKFVPILTTTAGSCLTLANWQALGVETFSFHLQSLLIKPGLTVLQTLPNLRSYLGWQGTLILNANSFDANLAHHKLRSPFDGSIAQIQREELLVLIAQLQTDRVIYDQRVQANFPYFEYKDTQLFSDFVEQANAANAGYVKGDFELAQLPLLNACAISHLESDRPANDALQGIVYSNGGLLNLFTEGSRQHERIDDTCSCPVCRQGYTKAYLHHLFAHTPLLCQRFLIQHNVTYYQKQLS